MKKSKRKRAAKPRKQAKRARRVPFGEVLHRLRLKHRLGIDEVARHSGHFSGWILRLEKGLEPTPETPDVCSLARGLNLTPLELAEFHDAAGSPLPSIANHSRKSEITVSPEIKAYRAEQALSASMARAADFERQAADLRKQVLNLQLELGALTEVMTICGGPDAPKAREKLIALISQGNNLAAIRYVLEARVLFVEPEPARKLKGGMGALKGGMSA